MIVYRLAKRKYRDDLSGLGASIGGGRWNQIGTKILYTSDSRALCTTEIAVHTPIGIIPIDYYLVTIEVPMEYGIEEVNEQVLPKKWKEFPHIKTTQLIGDEFIKREQNLILKVPSAVVQGDYNYLVNPRHESFIHVKILKAERFTFDGRLFVK